MNNLLKIIFVLCISVVLSMMTGCKSNPSTAANTNTAADSTGSKVKSDQAYLMVETEMDKILNGRYTTPSAFDQFKYSSALGLYNEAIALNPNNSDARFGAAITEMLAAYSDPEINKLIKDLDSAQTNGPSKSIVLQNLVSITPLPNTTAKMSISAIPAASGIVFTVQTALKDPPLISRVQQVLRDNFLPMVQAAINHLSQIDGNESFRFTITGKMQGDQHLKSVTIYPTEVALLHAAMNLLKFNIQTLLIYKFELPDYSQTSLVNALNQDNTSFFVLHTDGKQRAADAKATFGLVITKMRKAIDYLERISGAKSDAVIKLGVNGIKQSDLDTVKTYLTKVETSLSSNYNIELKNA
ncbi:MAG TPA: hypothetical protein VK141_10800, partial [Nitrosomonas sp.]|nr:hypothetical protein [Nitrosomonas sp.]